jgi:hypothetical protein
MNPAAISDSNQFAVVQPIRLASYQPEIRPEGRFELSLQFDAIHWLAVR